MSPLGLLTISLLLAAGPVPSGLQRGDELTYIGKVAETVERPGKRFSREHEIELRVFVLDRQPAGIQCAVLALLKRNDDRAVRGAIPAVTGVDPERGPAPPAARLDLVWVGDDGSVRLLLPTGPPPLRLTVQTPLQALPQVPLDAFAPFEFGLFAPQPPAGSSTNEWSVALDPTRPLEKWRVRGFDFVTAERCLELEMTQQTPGWDRPEGGHTAWRRIDRVWVSTLDKTARRVHRSIVQRDGLNPIPAVWIDVKYELKDQTRVIGRSYDRSRREIEVAYAAAVDLAALAPNAARLGPRPFDTKLASIDYYLKDSEPGTPYRAAVFAVRRLLEAARGGTAGAAVTDYPTGAATPARPRQP